MSAVPEGCRGRARVRQNFSEGSAGYDAGMQSAPFRSQVENFVGAVQQKRMVVDGNDGVAAADELLE